MFTLEFARQAVRYISNMGTLIPAFVTIRIAFIILIQETKYIAN